MDEQRNGEFTVREHRDNVRQMGPICLYVPGILTVIRGHFNSPAGAKSFGTATLHHTQYQPYERIPESRYFFDESEDKSRRRSRVRAPAQ